MGWKNYGDMCNSLTYRKRSIKGIKRYGTRERIFDIH